MKRIKLILILSLSTLLLLSCKEEKQPNIIFILADDYGYMDMQAYAQHTLGTDKEAMYYETPNLDRLTAEGVAFEQAYANQLCSPTRASLITGKYAARLGFTTATPKRDTYYNNNLPVPEGSYPHDVLDHHDPIKIEMALINGSTNTAVPSGRDIDNGWDETTIAEALPDYHSAFIGKWHIGGHGAEGYGPDDQGFEGIAWFDAGASHYFKWRGAWGSPDKSRFPDMPQAKMMHGKAGKPTGEDYLSDDLTEQAIRYIDKRSKIKDQPFFLYFCHFAVHMPLQAPEEDVAYFAAKDTKGWNGHFDPTYAGMVRGLDNSVGRILDKLEETGLDENTLVVFMSDNGGIDARVTPKKHITSNYPLTGGKANVTEGGIRVPLVMRWKGKVKGGQWCKVAVDCNDIFPTIVEAAGYDVKAHYDKKDGIDGRSLFGLLDDVNNKQESYTRDTHFWHYPFNVIYNNPYEPFCQSPQSVIRKGDYKLIFDWHGRLKLFNIEEDMMEQNNLAKAMPEMTNKLFADLMQWLDSNVKDTYKPTYNPDYNPENDPREVTYIDLISIYRNGGDVCAAAN